MRVDLLWLSEADNPAPVWDLGQVRHVAPNPAAVVDGLDDLGVESEFVLFWDGALGVPDLATLLEVIEVDGDVWHAGLVAGMAGLPEFLDYVNPNWRLNRDPLPDRVATSWRLSLRACLVRTEVISALGGPTATFDSLTAASLELGHRWISHGALMRHTPQLMPALPARPKAETLTMVDEFRFIRARFGAKWASWALWRAGMNRGAWSALWAAYRQSDDLPPLRAQRQLHSPTSHVFEHVEKPTVSVLIPTLDRYPYLFSVLDQLRNQTVPPLEIVVVDQTNLAERDYTWPERFADLPLQVIWRDEAGQCSSRNAGLQVTQGEAILFLDDDDVIGPDLIADHLAFLQHYGVDGSIGVSEEVGAGSLPSDFTIVRDSNVFSTGNSLLYRSALLDSGLFDLAYEHGSRADGDLGMRLYLAGRLLVLNPSACVIHLHAPRGGLRQHKARVITSASSRASLFKRDFMSPTEAYLICRYFTPHQAQEAVWIRTASSLGARQSGFRRLMRMAVMLVLLPGTYLRNRRYLAQGRRMLDKYPIIPELQSAQAKERS